MPDRRSATQGSYQQEAADGFFGPLASARYMRLTTFKPDGIPVSTSVHGVVDGDRAYFRVWNHSDTAKRLRHTDEVQVTACTGLGMAVGPPLDAVARPLPNEEASWVAGKLARKYPFRQRFLVACSPHAAMAGWVPGRAARISSAGPAGPAVPLAARSTR
jgi:uncharacterized protein